MSIVRCVSFFGWIGVELTREGWNVVKCSEALLETLALAAREAEKGKEGEVHSLVGLPGKDKGRGKEEQQEEKKLHLSLSRPLLLQTNQKDELRVGVRQVADKFAGSVHFFFIVSGK